MKVLVLAADIFKREGLRGLARRVKIRLSRLNLALSQRLNRDRIRSVYNITLKTNYPDVTFRLYVTGGYRFFLSDTLAHISHPFHFLDIGANQGLYSILAARNPHCQSILAFEPVSATADLFEANSDLNATSDKITLVRKAISDGPGTIDIRIMENHSGRASIAQGNTADVGLVDRVERVELIDHTGLDALTEKTLQPFFVKIDVEGHEHTVIEELLKSRIASQITQIFYECDERWMNKTDTETLLAAHGFLTRKIGRGTHYDVLADRAVSAA